MTRVRTRRDGSDRPSLKSHPRLTVPGPDDRMDDGVRSSGEGGEFWVHLSDRS